MKAIEPNLIKDNFIEIIGKEWMLVSAGDKDKFNMMTASWGGVGFLWNKPVVFVFIRPERYTREFVDEKGCFTLSFLGGKNTKRLIRSVVPNQAVIWIKWRLQA